MTAPPDVYRQRRARLAASIGRPLVIAAGRARARKYATNTHPFRAASTYLYFGGPAVEGAAWLIEPGSDGDSGCVLMRAARGFDSAVWTGETDSDEALASAAGLGAEAVTGPDELTVRLAGRKAAAICPPCPATMQWVASEGLESPQPDDLLPIIDMRLLKDNHEIIAMGRAADLGVQAQLVGMRAVAPGRREALVAAAFTSLLLGNEAEPSFTPIVTVRGEVLHGSGYHNIMRAGDLLLVDAGAEEPGGYTSDTTRTYPVDGEFTQMQRHLYDTVLRAERQAVAACVPGARYREIHDRAARTICEGLAAAGLLVGDPAELVDRKAHTLFFTHGLGHLIGLDVHDMEDFGDLAGYASGRTRRPAFGDKFLRLDRDLQAGMTVTIEPGIYLVPAIWQNQELIGPLADCINRAAVDSLLADGFGGIRIEDTLHVRPIGSGGPEILTSGLPKDPDEVTALIKGNLRQ